jgi:replicative DNA helicase
MTACHSLETVVQEVLVDLRSQGSPADMLPTGFTDLDYLLNGGLRRGELTALAGRPAMGKSSVAWRIANHMAAEGHGVLMFTSGTPRHYYATMGIAKILGIEPWGFPRRHRGNSALAAMLGGRDREIAAYRRLPILLDDTPSLLPGDLRKRIADLCRDASIPDRSIDLVVIEDLNTLRLNDSNPNDTLLAIQAMEALRNVAVVNNLHILVTLPVLRHVDERPNHMPMLKDIWGDGIVEQQSDVVIALYCDGYYDPESTDATVMLLVLKCRYGKGVIKFNPAMRPAER